VTPLTTAVLNEIADEVEVLRELRFQPDERFEAIEDQALTNAARWLRAASYSALEGARKLERIVRARHADLPPLSVAANESGEAF
jgi:hypothetical protein